MQNYSRVNNLDELITLSNIGRTSFFIKFKEEFGITAKQWMMKQLKVRILGKVNGGMQLRIASSVIPLLQTAFSLYSQATDRPLSGENQ